jgi:hypothetical protein
VGRIPGVSGWLGSLGGGSGPYPDCWPIVEGWQAGGSCGAFSQSVAACLRISRPDSEISEASKGKAQTLTNLGLLKTVVAEMNRCRATGTAVVTPHAKTEMDRGLPTWNDEEP